MGVGSSAGGRTEKSGSELRGPVTVLGLDTGHWTLNTGPGTSIASTVARAFQWPSTPVGRDCACRDPRGASTTDTPSAPSFAIRHPPFRHGWRCDAQRGMAEIARVWGSHRSWRGDDRSTTRTSRQPQIRCRRPRSPLAVSSMPSSTGTTAATRQRGSHGRWKPRERDDDRHRLLPASRFSPSRQSRAARHVSRRRPDNPLAQSRPSHDAHVTSNHGAQHTSRAVPEYAFRPPRPPFLGPP